MPNDRAQFVRLAEQIIARIDDPPGDGSEWWQSLGALPKRLGELRQRIGRMPDDDPGADVPPFVIKERLGRLLAIAAGAAASTSPLVVATALLPPFEEFDSNDPTPGRTRLTIADRVARENWTAFAVLTTIEPLTWQKTEWDLWRVENGKRIRMAGDGLGDGLKRTLRLWISAVEAGFGSSQSCDTGEGGGDVEKTRGESADAETVREDGYVVAPIDRTAYRLSRRIREDAATRGLRLTHPEFRKIVEDYTANQIRWTRPLTKDGNEDSHRMSVHLGDWKKCEDKLLRGELTRASDVGQGEGTLPPILLDELAEREADERRRKYGK